MSVRILPGEDLLTCVVRQDTRHGAGYDYLETTLDRLGIIILMADLSEQLVRIEQLQASLAKRRAASSKR
jgi:hypothetical protein